MVKNRMVRGSIAVAAALVPLGGASVLVAGPASAVPHGITCSKLSGKVDINANTSVTKLKTCTGNTGTKGKSKGTATPPTSITIKWANAKSTSINVSLATGSLCPATNSGGFALVADETESGTVATDNTGSTAPGAATSAEVCVYMTATTGVYSLNNAPGTKFVIAP